jgi:hypothetical protein
VIENISLICDNTVTTTTLSHLRHCHNYDTVTTTTLSQLRHCHIYDTVTSTILSHLRHCHRYDTVTTTTLSQLRYCHIYDTVTTTTLSQFVIVQEKRLKVLMCYNFLWVQRQHNCSPAASFENYLMTLYLLKVHLQTSLSIPITQKYQILSCDTLVANERYKQSLTFYSRMELIKRLSIIYVYLRTVTNLVSRK